MNAWRRFRIGVLKACFTEEEVLAFALDGLQGAARSVAKEHLEHCGPCREALRSVMELQDALAASVPELPEPAGLRERILAKLP